MSITINTTIAALLANATGVLYPLNPEEKVEGGPDFRGSIEKQEKVGEGYKTLARFEVAGWNAVSKDGAKRISLSVAGGMVRGALFKNEDPKGANPPDASGILGERETGTLQIAARRQTFRNGTQGMRLSIYQQTNNAGNASNSGGQPPADTGQPSDFPW